MRSNGGLLAQAIQDEIRTRQLSARAVGRLAGVDAAVVSRWLSGERGLSIGTADKLLTAFDLVVEPKGPIDFRLQAQQHKHDYQVNSLLDSIDSLRRDCNYYQERNENRLPRDEEVGRLREVVATLTHTLRHWRDHDGGLVEELPDSALIYHPDVMSFVTDPCFYALPSGNVNGAPDVVPDDTTVPNEATVPTDTTTTLDESVSTILDTTPVDTITVHVEEMPVDTTPAYRVVSVGIEDGGCDLPPSPRPRGRPSANVLAVVAFVGDLGAGWHDTETVEACAPEAGPGEVAAALDGAWRRGRLDRRLAGGSGGHQWKRREP